MFVVVFLWIVPQVCIFAVFDHVLLAQTLPGQDAAQSRKLKQDQCRQLGVLDAMSAAVQAPFQDGGYVVRDISLGDKATAPIVRVLRALNALLVVLIRGNPASELHLARLLLPTLVAHATANRELQVCSCYRYKEFRSCEFHVYRYSSALFQNIFMRLYACVFLCVRVSTVTCMCARVCVRACAWTGMQVHVLFPRR
jgi:hypothetical protein